MDDYSEENATVNLELSGVYVNYEPFSREGKPHPGSLWESKSLQYAIPTVPVYEIQKKVLKTTLSNAQIDTVKLAMTAFEKKFEDGSRQGFFLGDGAGVGKGVQIAGIFGECIARGMKKGVWISCSNALYPAALRDIQTCGLCFRLLKLSDYQCGEIIDVNNAVLFLTYSMLVSCSKENKTRLEQITAWLCSDNTKPEEYDGLIVLDESHKAKHVDKGTIVGQKVVSLQNILPNSKVLYSSATGLSEIDNVGYLTRLGMFGLGSAFTSSNDFISKLKTRGVSSSELLTVELKQKGVYIARILSMSNISIEMKICKNDISNLYNRCTKLWYVMLQLCGASSSYWSYHQRFFSSLILSSKVKDAVRLIKKALHKGYFVVVGLQETGEARFNKVKYENRIFSTAREILIEAANNLCAISLSKRPLVEVPPNSNDDFDEIQSWKLIKEKDVSEQRKILRELFDEISIDLPKNTIDSLIFELGGPKFVSEVSGRCSRQIVSKDGSIMIEQRNPKTENEIEREMFMKGKKKIAIISDAGSVGISMHDEKTKLNEMGARPNQRYHLTLQFSWSADKVVQQLGRTHRSNAASDPEYVMLSTLIPAEIRFLAPTSERLKTLGALTQGERRANKLIDEICQGQNFEHWKTAIDNTCKYVLKNEDPEETDDLIFAFNCVELLYFHKDKYKIHSELKDVGKFLNRIMGLPVAIQQRVLLLINEQVDLIVDNLKEHNKLDEGIKDLVDSEGQQCSLIKVEIFTKWKSQVNLATLQIDRGMKWDDVEKRINSSQENPIFFKRQDKALLAFPINQKNCELAEYAVYRPNNFVKKIIPAFNIGGTKIEKDEAKSLWEKQNLGQANGECLHELFRVCPEEHCAYGKSTFRIYLIYGSTVNIYDDLHTICCEKGQYLNVTRLTVSEGGKTKKILGILIPAAFIEQVLKYLRD